MRSTLIGFFSRSISATAPLFRPLRTASLALEHRIVMAPLTRCRCPSSVPTSLMAEHYGQRATRGGLLISEATDVSETARGYSDTPGAFTREQAAGWRIVSDRVHGAGGVFFVQLWHAGRASLQSLQPDGQLPVGPSSVSFAGQATDPVSLGLQDCPVNRALSLAEVQGVPGTFARSAQLVIEEGGADGVELHCCYGTSLLDQFLKSSSNFRSDAYGGSRANRARLLLDTVDAVSDAVGSHRVAVRLSPFSQAMDCYEKEPAAGEEDATLTGKGAAWELCEYVLGELAKRRLAYVHVISSSRSSLTPALRGMYPEGAVMVCGGYTPASAARIVSSGSADLVAFGTAFVGNPDLVERMRLGAPLRESDPADFYPRPLARHDLERGYLDQPALEGKAREELEAQLRWPRE